MVIRPITMGLDIGKIVTDLIKWDEIFDEFLNAVMHSPLWGKTGVFLEEVAPKVGAALFAIWVRSQGAIGKAAGDSVDEVEKLAGPTLLKAAAAGLSDYFGMKIDPGEIRPHAGFDGRRELSDKLGSLILGSMFGQFENATELTPEQGRDNAEAMIGFNLSTALEGWMGGVLTTGFLSKFFPTWADLDDIISQNLGFGRANRRVMGPLLTALIVTPFTWWLNQRLKPEILRETQLVRALYRDQITEDEYFETMGRHGWSRERAAILKVVNSRLLEKEDIQRAVEMGSIREDELPEIFGTLGYAPDMAEVMRLNTIHERVRTIFNAFESVGRDMFRDGEIDEPEYRSILGQAARSDVEVEAMLALGLLERSRMKADPEKLRRVPRGTVERAYRERIINRAQLGTFYTDQGYPEGDRQIMLALQDLLLARAIGGQIEATEEES